MPQLKDSRFLASSAGPATTAAPLISPTQNTANAVALHMLRAVVNLSVPLSDSPSSYAILDAFVTILEQKLKPFAPHLECTLKLTISNLLEVEIRCPLPSSLLFPSLRSAHALTFSLVPPLLRQPTNSTM